MHAVALFLSDKGLDGPPLIEADMQAHIGISIRNLEGLRLCCCAVGLLAALERKSHATPGRVVKTTGEVEALVAFIELLAGHALLWNVRREMFILRIDLRHG